jgi:tRNA (guanine-N7-)-methyltransferase
MSSEVETTRRSSRELRCRIMGACHCKSGVKPPHSKARYRARQLRKSCELNHAWKSRQFYCVNHLVAELRVARLDLVQLFGRCAPLYVDLGCGDGSFLCEMAQQFPKRNFLGIERLTKRVEKVRRKAEKIENVRMLRADTLFAVRYLLPESSVETFYLLFPDPWPKRRHHFRRIFSRDFLDAVVLALERHGVLRVATDQLDYFHQIERLSRAHSCFEVLDFHDAVRPMTKFERKFREQGAPIYRLTLRKTSPVT